MPTRTLGLATGAPEAKRQTCVQMASPMEQHALLLVAYRVRAASGSLTTVGSRTVNVDPSP